MLDALSVVVLPYCPHQSAASQIPVLITGISISSAARPALVAGHAGEPPFFHQKPHIQPESETTNQHLFCPYSTDVVL